MTLELLKACGQGDLPLIKKYVKESNINGVSDFENKFTPLFASFESDNIEAIVYLLDFGADPNKALTKDFGCYFPLEYIISQSMDLYKDGFTKEPDMSVIRLLIKYGANINQVGVRGETPLDRAIYSGHYLAKEYLRQHGAKTAKELEEDENNKNT